MVSVIIPCYNHGKFLAETVESILDSTYKQVEIIIVDDGSKDNSRAVAQRLMELNPAIQYLYQENAGPSRARNNGISNAKGTYILPLDADDLIHPNYITEAVNIFESKPAVKVVYAEAEKFGAVNKAWKLKPFSRRALALDNMIYVSALFRKADWARVGGYCEDPVCCREDWEFWIKLLKGGGDVVQLPFVGFYYRIHPDSRRKSMTKAKKNAEIAYLNSQHADFFLQQLSGPLRVNRSWSGAYNRLLKALGLLK